MKALFIGRFQPFHKGHLYVIKNIHNDYPLIVIGIGSSQYQNTLQNPFSSDERKKMITNSLQSNNIQNYKIILIPDIHNPPKWVDHVLSIYHDFDVVITNNSFTEQLFEDKGFFVKNTKKFNKKEFSGKEIRRRIINNESWEHLVPLEVVKIIKENDGINRIKQLASDY